MMQAQNFFIKTDLKTKKGNMNSRGNPDARGSDAGAHRINGLNEKP